MYTIHTFTLYRVWSYTGVTSHRLEFSFTIVYSHLVQFLSQIQILWIKYINSNDLAGLETYNCESNSSLMESMKIILVEQY